MPPVVVGVVLVVHGLITTMIGVGTVTNPNAPAMPSPSLFSWWPGPFGRSWLIDALHLGAGATVLGGVLWLVAGLALFAGGLGWLGVPGVEAVRYQLLLGGALLGLVALAVYFHPIYLIGIAINIAILVGVWSRVVPSAV